MATNKTKNPEEVLMSETINSAPAATGQTSDEVAAAEIAASESAAADKAAADKAAAAEEKKRAKAEAEKAKQDAAAAKASATESDHSLQAIEDNTAVVVNADPMVRIIVTPRTKEDKRVDVCINGHWWKIKKGEYVSVPQSVVLLLQESEKVLSENEALKGEYEAIMRM